MFIKYKVKAKRTWPQKYRSQLKEIVAFATEKLGLWSQDIDIQFVLGGWNKGMDCYGYCLQKNANEYLIRLNGIRKDTFADDYANIARIVFHELTHVKQHVFDGLELHDNITYFQGSEYKNHEYWNAPWEVEARENELKLRKVWERC